MQLKKGLPTLRKTKVEDFCKVDFYQKFAFWITHLYVQSNGESLALGSVLGYVEKVLTIGADYLFKGDPFFKDVDEIRLTDTQR